MSVAVVATMMQISDLHFGDTPGASANAHPMLPYIRYFDGLLGEHKPALRDLLDFYRDLSDREGSVPVFVTGDLTTTGDPVQFARASEFLGRSAPHNPFKSLGILAWKHHSILGNHDLWGNFWTKMSPLPGLENHFPVAHPIVSPIWNLNPDLGLRLIQLNSDADTGPFDRWLARGRFLSQLDPFEHEMLLPKREANEIRVLMLHHSITYGHRGTDYPQPSTSSLRPFEIEPGTARVLERFLVENEIHVVMTGHLHKPKLSALRAHDGQNQRSVLEARCGTTTVLDRYRNRTLASFPKVRRLPPNSLIVHRILRDQDARVTWRSEIYTRGYNGFAKSSIANGGTDCDHVLW